MFSRLRQYSHRLLAHLPPVMPSACALCGGGDENAVCSACHAQFFAAACTRCIHCAIPLPLAPGEHGNTSDTTCGDCLKHPPAFDATVVATDYAPPADQLVLALKFGNRLELAPLFARMLHQAAAHATPPARLTAVPLGRQRLVARGFNQALEIAKPLSRALGIALDAQLVIRQRDTQAQAMLHPDARRDNVRQAFVVPAAAVERVRGQHVGIVDDVMTTGETLHALAATLKRAGASRVTNFVFARTPQR